MHCGARGASQTEAAAVACPQEEFCSPESPAPPHKASLTSMGSNSREGHSY